MPAMMHSHLSIAILNVLVLHAFTVGAERSLNVNHFDLKNGTHVLPKLFDSGRVQRALDAAEAAEKGVDSIAQEGKAMTKEAREKNKAALLEIGTKSMVTMYPTAELPADRPVPSDNLIGKKPPTEISENDRAARVQAALNHASAAEQSIDQAIHDAAFDAAEARKRNKIVQMLALDVINDVPVPSLLQMEEAQAKKKPALLATSSVKPLNRAVPANNNQIRKAPSEKDQDARVEAALNHALAAEQSADQVAHDSLADAAEARKKMHPR